MNPFQFLTDSEAETLFYYGMDVSAYHDSRYYDPKYVEENGLTPDTCPTDIKNILMKEYGDDWQNKFWGKDYYEKFKKSN